jgi:hypothetical protein
MLAVRSICGPRVNQHHDHDRCKQDLENSTNKIMRAVSLFENDRIDAGLLPNNKGAPEKSGRKIKPIAIER